MKKIKKLVATTGEYVASDGTTKKRYLNVGSLFKDAENRVAIKMDCVPVGGEWNGWLSVYDLDPPREQQPQPAPVANNAIDPDDIF